MGKSWRRGRVRGKLAPMDAGREPVEVREAALRALLRLAAEAKTLPPLEMETDRAEQLRTLLISGADGRTICNALGLSFDRYVASLMRLSA